MDKIKKILIGTNNPGKYSEISDLLPKEIVKYSTLKLNIKSPEETGSSFMENSLLKASYFFNDAHTWKFVDKYVQNLQ